MPKTLLEVFSEGEPMEAYTAGLYAGIKLGAFRQGHDQGNGYPLGSDQRREWHSGFEKGCSLNKEFESHAQMAIVNEQSRRDFMANHPR